LRCIRGEPEGTPTAGAGARPGPALLETVAWVHVEAGRLLAVRSRGRDAFYAPGGKLEAGEDHGAALRREIAEELGIELDPATIAPLVVIDAPAHDDPGRRLRMRCYTASAAGEPVAGNEIDEIGWLDDPLDTRCAPAVSRLLRHLGAEPGRDT
jgi:8-oxo-dGTP pyrophosphatase MutT (NUDIX family)